MKSKILASLVFSSLLGSLAHAATVYDCKGGSFGPVKVEVKSSRKIMINDHEAGTVDTKFARANPRVKTHKIIGDFKSLGNGLEGYRVEVTVSKSLIEKSAAAFLNTKNRGPGGFYTESYKCTRR